MSGSSPITNADLTPRGELHFSENENNTNETKPFIWLRATGERVPVSREVYEAYYSEVNRTRVRAKRHGRCYCPQNLCWQCDGDCLVCPYHREGDVLSLNVPGSEEDGEEWGDSFADASAGPETAVEAKLMLNAVTGKLRELDPEADRMLAIWGSEENISDRELARRLGRNEETFKSQIRGYRKKLRKII